MRKIEEVLRLRAAGMSPRQIAVSIAAGKSTVYEYLARADAAGICWPLPEGMDEAAVDAKLFPEPTGELAARRPVPDWRQIQKEMKSKRHVTLRLLWPEFREANSESWGYSQFCAHYQAWRAGQDPDGLQDSDSRDLGPALWPAGWDNATVAGYAVIEAPSTLGLFPGGVEQLPRALLDAGLADAVGARHAGRVTPPPYNPKRDPTTGLLNPTGLRDYANGLADMTGEVLDAGDVPIVLGGDCSILLGNLLALRRRGRHGLLFIDGHADFYQPEAEPNGEAASMDLALATGRGPDVVADLEGRGPLVLDEDVVQFARRDTAEAAEAGSQRIEDTAIMVIDLGTVRRRGVERAAQDALEHLLRPELDGFWIHLDCDVLDDAVMPAVDYRPAGRAELGRTRTCDPARDRQHSRRRPRNHYLQPGTRHRWFDRGGARRLPHSQPRRR